MTEFLQIFKNNKSKIAALVAIELMVGLQGIYCFEGISSSKSVILFTAIAMVLIGALFALLFWKSPRFMRSMERLFVSALLILGLFYMVVFPPNSVPDEIYHLQASYKYSNIVLGEEVDGRTISVRNEDRPLFEDSRVGVSATHYREVLENVSLFATEEGEYGVQISNISISSNPPQVKFASVIGVSLGRLLNLGAYPVYYLGRLFNLLWFAFLAFLAVRFTPFGKSAFMAVSLLPMTLHTAASYSYDPSIMGMSLLLTALCLRAIFGEGKISAKLLVAIAVLVFLIAPCKVIYTFIALLVPFIPKERFESRKVCVLVKVGMLALAALSVLVLRLPSLLSLASSPAAVASAGSEVALDVRGNETGYFYGMSDVLGDPLGAAWLYLSSIGNLGSWYVETAIGGSLGWFQGSIVADDLVVFAFMIILLVSSLKSEDMSKEISAALRAGLLAIVLIVCVLAATSMLFAHTFIGEPYIMGVQGRYVLPVVVLLLLALQSRKIAYNGNQAPAVLVAAFALNLLYLNGIFATALTL